MKSGGGSRERRHRFDGVDVGILRGRFIRIESDGLPRCTNVYTIYLSTTTCVALSSSTALGLAVFRIHAPQRYPLELSMALQPS